jgi:hypothetical protein
LSACINRKAHTPWIVVIRRNSRCSAFEGYRRKWSPYSELYCPACEHLWRTKAEYVNTLPSATMESARARYKAHTKKLERIECIEERANKKRDGG